MCEVTVLDFLTIMCGIAALLGVALFILGWRGRRIDDHPWCRKCRFDLVGSPVLPPTCPECGTNLSATEAVRNGTRRRRAVMIVCGALVTALAGTWLGLVGSGVLAKVNWNQYKPTWWLAIDARSRDQSTLPPVITELSTRLARDELDAKRVQSLATTAMDQLVPMGDAWPAEWDRFLQRAWASDLLDDTTKRRYARDLFQPEVFLQPATLDGKPASFLACNSGTARRVRPALVFRCRVIDLRSDGVAVSILDADSMSTGISDGVGLILSPLMTFDDPSAHRVHATIQWRVSIISKPRSEDAPVPAEAVWETTHTLSEVSKSTALPVVQLLTDNESRSALTKAICVTVCAIRGKGAAARNGAVWLNVFESPVEVQAHVSCWMDDKSISRRATVIRNPIWRGATVSSSSGTVTLKIPNESVMSLDLVLAPTWYTNPAYHRDPSEPIRLWYGELPFPGVPVQWYDDVNDRRILPGLRELLQGMK